MRITDEPVENIDFDWCNAEKTTISKRLPGDFLRLCVKARMG
jgi:hypothetical protein